MSWPTVELQEFCRTGSGATPSRKKTEFFEGSIPWVKSGELREKEILGTEEHVSEEALRSTSLKMVPAGALLVAMYGATVGRVGLLGIDATTNQAVCHVVPDPEKADRRYMFHLLQARAAELVSKGVGGAQPNISQGTIKQLKIPLPPLAEQKRIAGILDQAAELCRLRTRALEKLNTLGQAIFYEMFLGTSRKTVPLSGILREVQIGPFGSLLHKSDYVSGGTPLINPMHINSGQLHPDLEFTVSDEKLAKLHRYILMEGDIVMGRRGEMGRCAVVSGEHPQMICGTGSMVLRVNKKNASPDFLGFFLSTPEAKHRLENAASGVTMLNLNTKSLDDVPVPLTSIEEQETFADKLRSIRKQTSIFNIAVSEASALFASLQHRAFRGEL